MSIRRSHRNGNQGASHKARIARIRDKALRMRERIKQATTAMLERRLGYVSWWQRAFRVPTISFFAWCRTRATTMLAALMMMLGLKSTSMHRTVSAKRGRRKNFRSGLRSEQLEARQLMAVDLPRYPPLGGVAFSSVQLVSPGGGVSNGGVERTYNLAANPYAGALDKVNTLYWGLDSIAVGLAGSNNLTNLGPSDLTVIDTPTTKLMAWESLNIKFQSGPSASVTNVRGKFSVEILDYSGTTTIVHGSSLPTGYATKPQPPNDAPGHVSGALLAVREGDKAFKPGLNSKFGTDRVG